MFQLWIKDNQGNNQLLGSYVTKDLLLMDAFELLLDNSMPQVFEIIELDIAILEEIKSVSF